jgi:2-hydroxy-3-keto-5-methylthiopentenyl-1-phosphate phosphatase
MSRRRLFCRSLAHDVVANHQTCPDFDGTIFMQDTGHTLFDNFGCGPDRRAILAKQMESGERTFREVSDELLCLPLRSL